MVEIQDGHSLVDKGPYRYVRHPAYTGGLFAILGLSVLAHSLLSVVSALILTTLTYILRIRREEELISAFGEEYLRMSWRKKRLIPFVPTLSFQSFYVHS